MATWKQKDNRKTHAMYSSHTQRASATALCHNKSMKRNDQEFINNKQLMNYVFNCPWSTVFSLRTALRTAENRYSRLSAIQWHNALKTDNNMQACGMTQGYTQTAKQHRATSDTVNKDGQAISTFHQNSDI